MTARVIPAPYPPAAAVSDPRIPAYDRVVTRDLMERWNHEQPDKVFLKFGDDGEEWTYARLRELTLQTALGLQQQGVKQGDTVLVWLPNSRECLRVFMAVQYLGAVFVAINTAYKGALLAHVVANANARLAVVHADLLPRLVEIDTAALESIIVVGGAGAPVGRLRIDAYERCLLPSSGTLEPPPRAIAPWDPCAVIYTSGTTGPSKGVLCSYLHLFSNAGPETWPFLTADDRYLVNMPMFHIGGIGGIYVMFARGASVSFVERFDTATFWSVVRATGTTAGFLLGVMAAFLEKQPPSPDDRDHPLRLALMVPLAGDIAAFSERFGVAIHTIFNMTEISSPIVSGINPTVRGTCGRPRPGVEVRLVDENDCEVAQGQVGEMLVRTDRPWAMNSGYHRNPEATAKAWRNGWFHTGDAFRVDAEGNFYFVDRMKDAIRRRGENISSFEVEADVVRHPAVREAAAVGVPSELAEEDVLVVVAPVQGRDVDPAELLEFLRARMAHFMVPRYVRVVAELPKTPTAKVQKNLLREQGVTPDTWDRERAGIRVRMDRIGGKDPQQEKPSS
ncbi:MAG: ATP-dependent acyl-CoA ligase [Panacagrimonas sp.]|jgi:crotonobetaine/carnitine-CoA ligase|nr:AMP-binding protein [Panacagrimonas sp.]MCC2655317.1 ATP-dependent acyl-CoA ligase [Panacagrimonas sp.]